MTFDDHDLEGASEIADARCATEGRWLADLECRHGNLEPCDECDAA